MRCDRARAVASARADGEVSAADVALLDAHLGSCPGCRSFVATTEQVRTALALGRVDGAPDVTGAVLDRLGSEGGARRSAPGLRPARRDRQGRRARRDRGGTTTPTGRPGRVGSRAAVVALLAMAVVVAGAFWIGRGTRPDQIVDTRGGLPPGDLAASPSSRPWNGSRAVVWSRDRLDPGLVDDLDDVPSIVRTSVVARGTVGLDASRAVDGSTVFDPGDGWSVPLDAIGIDPGSYAPLIGGPDATTLRLLRPGQAVLGASSARLRGVGAGAELDVSGQRLEVVAVVSDRSVGAAEVAVDRETGVGLGLTVDRYAVVGYRGEPTDLVDDVTGATDVPTRVRDEADTPFLRNGDAVLPQIQVKERYGEFATRTAGEDVEVDPRWFGTEIETVDLPQVGSVTCHRRVLPALRAVLADLDADGLGGLVRPDRFQGCWNPKEVRATGDLSHHTWGAAVDLAPIVVDGTRTQDPRLVAAFERHGFTWGGTWLVADPEHFELLDPPA